MSAADVANLISCFRRREVRIPDAALLGVNVRQIGPGERVVRLKRECVDQEALGFVDRVFLGSRGE